MILNLLLLFVHWVSDTFIHLGTGLLILLCIYIYIDIYINGYHFNPKIYDNRLWIQIYISISKSSFLRDSSPVCWTHQTDMQAIARIRTFSWIISCLIKYLVHCWANRIRLTYVPKKIATQSHNSPGDWVGGNAGKQKIYMKHNKGADLFIKKKRVDRLFICTHFDLELRL